MAWWFMQERCAVAAFADAHRAIKRPKAEKERIAFAPIDLPPNALLGQRRQVARPGVGRGRAGTVSAGAACGGWRNSRSVKDVFSGSHSPNCNGLTITQIGGNMAQAPAHGFPEIAH
jgi:hypothetical protein